MDIRPEQCPLCCLFCPSQLRCQSAPTNTFHAQRTQVAKECRSLQPTDATCAFSEGGALTLSFFGHFYFLLSSYADTPAAFSRKYPRPPVLDTACVNDCMVRANQQDLNICFAALYSTRWFPYWCPCPFCLHSPTTMSRPHSKRDLTLIVTDHVLRTQVHRGVERKLCTNGIPNRNIEGC